MYLCLWLRLASAPWIGEPKFRQLLNHLYDHAKVPLTKSISHPHALCARVPAICCSPGLLPLQRTGEPAPGRLLNSSSSSCLFKNLSLVVLSTEYRLSLETISDCSRLPSSHSVDIHLWVPNQEPLPGADIPLPQLKKVPSPK